MKTPYLLFSTVAVAAASLVSMKSLAAETEPESNGKRKPNILLISIDDMRPQIGASGYDYMITPNLDKLASQGRLFIRHYAQVPTCGASRQAMLTGQNPTSPGHLSHHHFAKSLRGTAEPKAPETLLHHFKQQGYVTVGMGKISHAGGK